MTEPESEAETREGRRHPLRHDLEHCRRDLILASCFISQLGDCIPWHAVCLQEAFKRLENLDNPGGHGHVVYTPSLRPQRFPLSTCLG